MLCATQTASRVLTRPQLLAHFASSLMLLALALASRCLPSSRLGVPSMCWIDEQDSSAIEKVVDVAPAVDGARAALGPSPKLEPLEVLEMMLAAFQRGGNDDIEDLFKACHAPPTICSPPND